MSDEQLRAAQADESGVRARLLLRHAKLHVNFAGVPAALLRPWDREQLDNRKEHIKSSH